MTRTRRPAADRAVEDTLTCQAFATAVASSLYDEARTSSNPAAALDDIADALPTTMAKAFKSQGTAPEMAAVLLPAVTDRVWAFTAVEHARTEVGDGFGYLLDLLADSLKQGADPNTVRADTWRLAKQLRTEQAGGTR
ncbi:hypothetical protein HLK59_10120 [Streptomyces sp. S3(2020)]|uniref:hypothetical protein n=1 Tax=Streptomyces sp. S3(2020) TaxID=2732044 RepID=UPI001488DA9A|nr:hypothetical protein [Streptomyces sp. S3(2020)]NNN30712.1 hypothetical protein [Streptomyces sp. S3(2020)]